MSACGHTPACLYQTLSQQSPGKIVTVPPTLVFSFFYRYVLFFSVLYNVVLGLCTCILLSLDFKPIPVRCSQGLERWDALALPHSAWARLGLWLGVSSTCQIRWKSVRCGPGMPVPGDTWVKGPGPAVGLALGLRMALRTWPCSWGSAIPGLGALALVAWPLCRCVVYLS